VAILKIPLFRGDQLKLNLSTAADLDFSTRKAIDSAVVAEMEKREVVGLAIGIIQDGEVVYTKGLDG
jgi:hypothetical protein